MLEWTGQCVTMLVRFSCVDKSDIFHFPCGVSIFERHQLPVEVPFNAIHPQSPKPQVAKDSLRPLIRYLTSSVFLPFIFFLFVI